MAALQDTCDGWASDLESKLNRIKELNAAKLALAQKQIQARERWQLTLSIGLNLLLVCTIAVLGKLLGSALGNAWDLMDAYKESSQNIAFYAISISAALIVGALSLANGMAAPAYGDKNRSKFLWLFILFGILIYVCVCPNIAAGKIDPVLAGILALIGIVRTLLEFYLCRLKDRTRSHSAQVSCRVGSMIAKAAGVAQWLICLGLTALYVCCLLLIL